MSREVIVAKIATLNAQLDDLDREAGRIRPDGTRYWPKTAFITRDLNLAVKLAEFSGGTISCDVGTFTVDLGDTENQTWMIGDRLEAIIEEHTGTPYRKGRLVTSKAMEVQS